MGAGEVDESGRPPPATLLLIEDDPDARYVVSARMAEAFPDARVIAVESAEAGLELAARTRPSAIVLDLVLRGMEGFLFMQRAKEISDAPVIVLTGDARPESRAQALRMGAVAYLVKPEGVDELSRVLGDVLRADRLGDETEGR